MASLESIVAKGGEILVKYYPEYNEWIATCTLYPSLSVGEYSPGDAVSSLERILEYIVEEEND